jgi:isochorismate synthase EntC
LAGALHPTPAVGGIPVKAALDALATHGAPRGWYTGGIGWFDADGDGEVAVALRSGLVEEHRVQVFVGAGIVAGSRPHRELQETELKARPLLSALGQDTEERDVPERRIAAR